MGGYAMSPRGLPEHHRATSSYSQMIIPASPLMEVQPSIVTPALAPQAPHHPLTNEAMGLEAISNRHSNNDSSNNIYYHYNSAIGGQSYQQAAGMKVSKINNIRSTHTLYLPMNLYIQLFNIWMGLWLAVFPLVSLSVL